MPSSVGGLSGPPSSSPSSTVSGPVPTGQHLSHHHHLRSLSQRSHSAFGGAASAGAAVDSGGGGGAPFGSHLRELETLRRKGSSNSNGTASNSIDMLQSGSANETTTTGNTTSRGQHHLHNHHHQQQQQEPQQHHQLQNYHRSPHQQQTTSSNGYSGQNSEAQLQLDGDCQGYKPNAPHIQGKLRLEGRITGFNSEIICFSKWCEPVIDKANIRNGVFVSILCIASNALDIVVDIIPFVIIA